MELQQKQDKIKKKREALEAEIEDLQKQLERVSVTLQTRKDELEKLKENDCYGIPDKQYGREKEQADDVSEQQRQKALEAVEAAKRQLRAAEQDAARIFGKSVHEFTDAAPVSVVTCNVSTSTVSEADIQNRREMLLRLSEIVLTSSRKKLNDLNKNGARKTHKKVVNQLSEMAEKYQKSLLSAKKANIVTATETAELEKEYAEIIMDLKNYKEEISRL